MNFQYYIIGLAFIIGFVTFLVGLRQGPQEAPETAAEKLTRVRARRDEIAPDAKSKMERELDREFAKREEARVKQQRRETFVPSMSKLTMAFRPFQRLEEELLQARSPWRASELIVASAFAAVVVFLILCPLAGIPPSLAVPLSALCFLGPWVVVRFMKVAYQRRFEVQLADTLMMMANGLRAGFSFLQTMEMVSRESLPPVADEFQRLTQEIAVGVPVNQALENMAARVRSNDLDLVVTAVLIQREVGSSLAEVLEIIARVIGERLRIRGEIRTLTSQGRLTGALLGFLPLTLGVLIHLMGRVMSPGEPSFVQPLIDTAPGQAMLAVGIVMQIIGFLIIMKIVAIKV